MNMWTLFGFQNDGPDFLMRTSWTQQDRITNLVKVNNYDEFQYQTHTLFSLLSTRDRVKWILGVLWKFSVIYDLYCLFILNDLWSPSVWCTLPKVLSDLHLWYANTD